MSLRSNMVLLAVVAIGILASGQALCVARIHGNLGLEQYIFVNARGEDAGNAGAVTDGITGYYELNDLPGDKIYLMGTELYRFWLADGEDKDVTGSIPTPPERQWPRAYSVPYGPTNIHAYRIGQTFIANERYLRSVSVLTVTPPEDIHCVVYEYRPEGWADGNPRGAIADNGRGDLGCARSAWGLWSAGWSPQPAVKLTPGKKYYMEFTLCPCDPANAPNPKYGCQDFMQLVDNTDRYCDGEVWILDARLNKMVPSPDRDLGGSVSTVPPFTVTDYATGWGNHWPDMEMGVMQTFTAKGNWLRYVHFHCEWERWGGRMDSPNNFLITVYHYTGNRSNPKDYKVGVTKRGCVDPKYNADGLAVLWDYDEVPLVPGEKYLVEITKEDPGSYNKFQFMVNNNDTSGQGDCFTVDMGTPTYRPNWSFSGSIVSDLNARLSLNISNIQAIADHVTSRLITWTTDVAATSQVEYWPAGGCHKHTVLDENKTTNHSVSLCPLTGGTAYYFKVKSYADIDHAYPVSDQQSFATGCAGKIYGWVTDSASQPKAYAQISLSPAGPCGSYATSSGMDGYYEINNIEPGTYSATCQWEQLLPQTVSGIAIPAPNPPCSPVRQDFQLSPPCEYVANGSFETAPYQDPAIAWPFSYSGCGPSTPDCTSTPPKFQTIHLGPGEKWHADEVARTGSTFVTDTHRWQWYNNWLGQVVCVVPGKTYRLTAFYQIYWTGSNPNSVMMQIAFDPQARTTIPIGQGICRSPIKTWPIEAVLSPWLPISVDCAATGSSATVWLICYQNGGDWHIGSFDDVTLSRVESSLQAAKAEPNGTRVAIDGLVVTAGMAQLTDKLYVSTQNRTSGIQCTSVSYDTSVVPGDIVKVEGRLATRDGERVLENCVVIKTSNMTPLRPLGVVAGKAWEYYGISTMGLLVRCAGTVVEIGADYFKISDGSADQYGAGADVVVELPSGVPAPTSGQVVSVTGPCGKGLVGAQEMPVVRLRDASDLVVVYTPP